MVIVWEYTNDFCTFDVGALDLSNGIYQFHEMIGKVLSLGILLATNGINVVYELGHRTNQTERSLAKLLLCPSLYMHFYIEHNFGHHKNVSTPKDRHSLTPSECVFFLDTFGSRTIFKRVAPTMAIAKKPKSFLLVVYNDMLFYILFQGFYLGIVYQMMSATGLGFAIAIAVVSFLMLETINYIEHYGLERKKLSSGRYERVQAHHSWNSNHDWTNGSL